jgi:hypothetical protein
MADYTLEQLMAERARRQQAAEDKPAAEEQPQFSVEELKAEQARRQQAKQDQDTTIQPEDKSLVEGVSQFGSGFAKGLASIPGIPGDIEALGRAGLRKAGLENIISPETYFPKSQEFIEAFKPTIPALKEEPTTVAGEYGKTLGEFSAQGGLGPGAGARNVIKYGIVPGAASETAGQLTKGTELEPWARGAGALAGAGISHILPGAPTTAKSIQAAIGNASAEQLENAERLFQQASAIGVPISRFEALQQVLGAQTHAGDLQRVIEGSGRMKEFYADRPQQIEQTGRELIETIAPETMTPSLTGKAAGEAALGEQVQAASSRTQRAGPYYEAAKGNEIAPQHVHSVIDQIDDLIAQDKTGLTHSPLLELKEQLTAQPARSATAPSRTPVTDPKTGRIIRYELTPGTPSSSLVPVTNVENLDRTKKYWRDRTDLPAFSDKAIDKELAAKINGLIEQLDPAMRERSVPLRLGRTAYQQATREILDPLMAGPIGKLAKEDLSTKQAIEALFPKDPLAQSRHEVADAVSRLVERNPVAAKEVVRAYIENTFNTATRELQSGASQYGGANFRKALLGNPQAAANLDAALRALPSGDNIARGFDRFMEVMGATGKRQHAGSPTEFNKMIREQLQNGSISQQTGELLLSFGTRWPGRVKEALATYNEGRNLDRLARVITDPAAAREFARLAEKNTPAETARIIARIASMQSTASRGTESKFGINYDSREQRASGGKVGKDYPAKKLNRMEKAVLRAQKAIAEETKPIMEMPDAQVAQALEIAKDK